MKADPTQRMYAAWLLESEYIPLPRPVEGRAGVRKDDVTIGEPPNEPSLEAAGRLELRRARAATQGGEVPAGWPGARCLGVARARGGRVD